MRTLYRYTDRGADDWVSETTSAERDAYFGIRRDADGKPISGPPAPEPAWLVAEREAKKARVDAALARLGGMR